MNDPACGFGNVVAHAKSKELTGTQLDVRVGVIHQPKFVRICEHDPNFVIANDVALSNGPHRLTSLRQR